MAGERDGEGQILSQQLCRRGHVSPSGGSAQTRHLGREQSGGPAGHAVAEVLGEQELGVATQPPGEQRKADEGPGQRASAELDQAFVDRAGHPGVEIGMGANERRCRRHPLAAIAGLASEKADVVGIGLEEARRGGRG